MGSLSSLSSDFEQLGRIYKRIAKKMSEIDMDPALVQSTETQRKPYPGVNEVYDKYVEARAAHYADKLGREPKKGSAPALTPQRVKLIRDAVGRHGTERVKRAVLGMFLSAWHKGENPDNKEYLEIERALVIKKKHGGQIDMVDYFAAIYQEIHDEY
jgi:hypothetical protein